MLWQYAPAGKPAELWFRLGRIKRVDGDPLKDDKDGKNTNPDASLLLQAMDPPLRYPLNESRLKDKFRVRGEVDDPREAIDDARKTAESKKKRDLKKRKEKGEKISDEEQNATAFDEAEFNRTFFNATLEPWDADAGGLELVPGNASLVVVHRSALAYVDVDVSESRGNNRGRVPTYTLKSSMKSDTEDVLMASMGKWWHALAEEWKRSAACVPGAGAGDDDAGAPKKGPTDKYKAPKPPTYGDEYRAAANATNATAAANATAPAPDAVAAAIAKEYLDRLRTRAEVLESVDARLEALEKKLAWVDDARNRSVLSADEHAAQRAALLAGLAALEA